MANRTQFSEVWGQATPKDRGVRLDEEWMRRCDRIPFLLCYPIDIILGFKIMVKSVDLSPEIESRLSVISRQVGLGEDELITEAIMNYLEYFEDIQETQIRLSTPRLISKRGICIHYDVAKF